MEKFSSLDDEDKKKYISNMQTARDTYNQLEYAKKKGREEGLQAGIEKGREEGRMEGREEGIEKRSREIAVNLLRINLPVQTICEATGLSAEEITKLQSES
ncbi:MAG: hypothetical protein MR502_06365 [Bacteroides sp.]|nr:hypothetical protein [Bacteroides sp.]